MRFACERKSIQNGVLEEDVGHNGIVELTDEMQLLVKPIARLNVLPYTTCFGPTIVQRSGTYTTMVF